MIVSTNAIKVLVVVLVMILSLTACGLRPSPPSIQTALPEVLSATAPLAGAQDDSPVQSNIALETTLCETFSTFAYEVVRLVNIERAREGLPPVEMHPLLMIAAQMRAFESLETLALSHTRPDGRDWYTVLSEAPGLDLRSAGENLARGQRTPERVLKSWMNSPEHRYNIMLQEWHTIGVGIAQNNDGRMEWVQIFGPALVAD